VHFAKRNTKSGGGGQFRSKKCSSRVV